MLFVDNIQILCGSLADQAAIEETKNGIFTGALLDLLARHPELLTVELDLETWQAALPKNLLEKVDVIDSMRGVLGDDNEVSDSGRNSQEPMVRPDNMDSTENSGSQERGALEDDTGESTATRRRRRRSQQATAS